jgi:hypothetical protein
MWRSARTYFLSLLIPVFMLVNIIAFPLAQISRTDTSLDRFVAGNLEQLLAITTEGVIAYASPAEVAIALRVPVVLRGSIDTEVEQALQDATSVNPMDYWAAATLASFVVLIAFFLMLFLWLAILVLSAMIRRLFALHEGTPGRNESV